jgi:hypothetical protein
MTFKATGHKVALKEQPSDDLGKVTVEQHIEWLKQYGVNVK